MCANIVPELERQPEEGGGSSENPRPHPQDLRAIQSKSDLQRLLEAPIKSGECRGADYQELPAQLHAAGASKVLRRARAHGCQMQKAAVQVTAADCGGVARKETRE